MVGTSELEKIAKEICGGKVIKGRHYNFNSFMMVSHFPMSLFSDYRLFIDNNKHAISVYREKDLKKVEELIEQYKEVTGDSWRIKKYYNE